MAALRTGPREATDDLMPVRDPQLTFRQVREQAQVHLVGPHLRRLLLWRYLLVWRRPQSAAHDTPSHW